MHICVLVCACVGVYMLFLFRLIVCCVRLQVILIVCSEVLCVVCVWFVSCLDDWMWCLHDFLNISSEVQLLEKLQN